MLDKRKYFRLNAHLDVSWKKSADPVRQAESRDDGTKNISEGGVCLNVYEKVEVGDCLDLAIKLSNQKVIHSKGRVQWVKESEIITKRYDVGLEFLNISSQDREEIKNLILASFEKRGTL